jgi:hypothetical protein
VDAAIAAAARATIQRLLHAGCEPALALRLGLRAALAER